MKTTRQTIAGQTPGPSIRPDPDADPAKSLTVGQAYEAFFQADKEYAVALVRGGPLRRLTQKRRKAWQVYRKVKLANASDYRAT